MSTKTAARKVDQPRTGKRPAGAPRDSGSRLAGRLALNSGLLRKRLGSTAEAAKALGVRPATVSNLLTGKTDVAQVRFATILGLADLAGCRVDDLVIREKPSAPGRETFADSLRRWSQAVGAQEISGAEDLSERSERERVSLLRRLPKAPIAEQPSFRDPNAL